MIMTQTERPVRNDGEVYYVLVQLEPRVEIARAFGPLPVRFHVPHAPDCGILYTLDICSCRPPMRAEAVCDPNGEVLWSLPNPPMLCVNDNLDFDWTPHG